MILSDYIHTYIYIYKYGWYKPATWHIYIYRFILGWVLHFTPIPPADFLWGLRPSAPVAGHCSPLGTWSWPGKAQVWCGAKKIQAESTDIYRSFPQNVRKCMIFQLAIKAVKCENQPFLENAWNRSRTSSLKVWELTSRPEIDRNHKQLKKFFLCQY